MALERRPEEQLLIPWKLRSNSGYYRLQHLQPHRHDLEVCHTVLTSVHSQALLGTVQRGRYRSRVHSRRGLHLDSPKRRWQASNLHPSASQRMAYSAPPAPGLAVCLSYTMHAPPLDLLWLVRGSVTAHRMHGQALAMMGSARACTRSQACGSSRRHGRGRPEPSLSLPQVHGRTWQTRRYQMLPTTVYKAHEGLACRAAVNLTLRVCRACAGPERSGSTWLFNAIRILCQDAQQPLDPFWITMLSQDAVTVRGAGCWAVYQTDCFGAHLLTGCSWVCAECSYLCDCRLQGRPAGRMCW